MDYYAVLDLDRTATLSEIKTSFRNKLKQLHPDLNNKNFITSAINKSDNSELLHLIRAYTILSNPLKRKRYNKDSTHISDLIRRKRKIFDYEKFLMERQHIFAYRAKLFLYDLVYKTGEKAEQIYEKILKQKKKLLLKNELGKLDYFDSLYLLAENYQKKNTAQNMQMTFDLYLEIFQLEERYEYFKDYMLVVTENIFELLEKHIETGAMNIYSPSLERLLDRIAHWRFPRNVIRKAKSLKKIAKRCK